ncbi:MAG TPA: hypothetical protein VF194_03985 [Ferrovibrio sp.]|jgi:uncharacterized membrane protein|uniref:hypothetical protein n=1 Tax=Ferrovibrio sp. TaxID=1917215 RepID=UPI002ED29627
MNDLLIARALHVLSIVIWIGGVAFVTLIGLPLARRQPTMAQKRALFEAIEGPFSRIARWAVALAGLSGLWMLRNGALWYRFSEPGFWWMHAMVGLWLLFAVMLYIVEPFFLHRRRHDANTAPDFTRMFRLHILLLGAALVTIAGAVIGSH